jgi:hypothetical protein
MIRLLAFLITGFWPSQSSLLALRKRLDRLEYDHATYKKRLNRLWGAYYATGEIPPTSISSSSSADEFPEEEFQTQLALRKGGLNAREAAGG